MVTLAPAAKFAPLIVTVVPPMLEPAFGVTLLMRGAVDEGLVVEPPHAAARAASVSRAPSGDRRKIRACKLNSILAESRRRLAHFEILTNRFEEGLRNQVVPGGRRMQAVEADQRSRSVGAERRV